MTARDDRMSELFDYMVLSPQGATVEDMAAHLQCSVHAARDSIRDLRIFLGDDDQVNLTCNPDGANQRWLYRLVTKLDDHREWVANRVIDTESRIETMHAMLSSAVRATDGRSVAGKRARVMCKQLGRLLEDLRELDDAAS